MGFRQLEELAKDAKGSVIVVVNEQNGFSLLLRDQKLRDDPKKMKYVLKVLATAINSQGFDNLLSRALSIIVESKFLDSLKDFNLSVLPSHVENYPDIDEIVSYELILIDQIVQMCPSSFVMNVLASANSLEFAVQKLESAGHQIKETTKTTLSRIHDILSDLRTQTSDNGARALQKRRDFMAKLHEREAPEDFRTLSVVPTVEELLTDLKPFVRTNIVDGAYKSPDHYLDVQFRLMKEDFVAPLRDGIQAVLAAVQEDGKFFGKKNRRFQVHNSTTLLLVLNFKFNIFMNNLR
jgi:hypothetical protein